MVRVNTLILTWCLILGISYPDNVFNYYYGTYRRIRHDRMNWKNGGEYASELRQGIHGQPICTEWRIVTFHNGLYFENKYDCFKFRERHGYCPSTTICSWPLPHFLTTVYQCFHDFNCPRSHKCCEDSCFVHKVCHPLVLEKSEPSETIYDPVTDTTTENTVQTSEYQTTKYEEPEHMTVEVSTLRATSATQPTELQLITNEESSHVSVQTFTTLTTPTQHEITETTTDIISLHVITTDAKIETAPVASSSPQPTVVDRTTKYVVKPEATTHVFDNTQTGLKTAGTDNNSTATTTKKTITTSAIGIEMETTISKPDITETTIHYAKNSSPTPTATEKLPTQTSTSTNLTTKAPIEPITLPETSKKSITSEFQTKEDRNGTISSSEATTPFVDEDGSGSGDYYDVPQPEAVRSLSFWDPIYEENDDEDLDRIEIV